MHETWRAITRVFSSKRRHFSTLYFLAARFQPIPDKATLTIVSSISIHVMEVSMPGPRRSDRSREIRCPVQKANKATICGEIAAEDSAHREGLTSELNSRWVSIQRRTTDATTT